LLGTAIGAIIGVISIGFSLAFVYVGFTLPKLLRVSANRIVMLLYASTGWTVFFFLLSLLGGPSVSGLVALVLTLLILWYLLKNVRRLAAEVQAAPSEAPPPGPTE
jgi:Ca2+/Na+ antiporter